MRLAEPLRDIWIWVWAANQVMDALTWFGRLHEAREVCDRVLEVVGENPDLQRNVLAYALLRHYQALCMSYMGQPEEALATWEGAIALARELRMESQVVFLHSCAVMPAYELEGAARASALAQRSAHLAEEHGSAFLRLSGQAGLQYVKNRNGEYEAAIEAAEMIRTIARETYIGDHYAVSMLPELILSELAQYGSAAARRTARETLDLTREYEFRAVELRALISFARISLVDGEPSAPEAETLLEQAMQLVDEIGAVTFRPEIWELRSGIARLRGDEEARLRHLHEAHRLATEMGATGHAERLARELGL
jgi:tetratricopeptide (TPR) repeat protein